MTILYIFPDETVPGDVIVTVQGERLLVLDKCRPNWQDKVAELTITPEGTDVIEHAAFFLNRTVKVERSFA